MVLPMPIRVCLICGLLICSTSCVSFTRDFISVPLDARVDLDYGFSDDGDAWIGLDYRDKPPELLRIPLTRDDATTTSIPIPNGVYIVDICVSDQVFVTTQDSAGDFALSGYDPSSENWITYSALSAPWECDARGDTVLVNGENWIWVHDGANDSLVLMPDGEEIRLAGLADESRAVVVTESNDILTYANDEWRYVGTLLLEEGDLARVLYIDTSGVIWIASRNRVYWVDQGNSTVELGPEVSRVLTMQSDEQGRLWLLSASGIYLMDGKAFKEIPIPIGYTPVGSVLNAMEQRVLLLSRYGFTRWSIPLGEAD